MAHPCLYGRVTPWVLAVVMDLAVMDEALARLGATDPSERSDPESISTLLRQWAEFDSLVTQSVASFDALGEWQASEARSATAWLQSVARLPKRTAQVLVRRGRALRHLHHTRAAWAEGAVTGAHVDVMVSLRGEATEEALARDEGLLVEKARTLTYDRFVRAVAYWKQLADPDGSDEAAERRRAGRDAYLVRSFSGTWFGQMTLDPISGAIVGDELQRLEQLLFDGDWAEAKERLGREPTVSDVTRSPGQRRADALVLMATRSNTAPVDGRKPHPLFTVLVGYETMYGRISQLEDGSVVPPGSLLPWLEEADLERAEYRADGTVAVGARARITTLDLAGFDHAVLRPITRVECPPADRFFTGATRRAIEIRDRECCHPSCDLQASRCQVDHVQPYAQGGLTTQENGRLLCSTHNRMRNHVDQRRPPQRE